MPSHAALDVSQETTAVCVVDETGRILAEKKIATCPDAIAAYLTTKAPDLVRVGLETGPMAVWLWNELAARGLPILCIDARHANAALKMRPVKTDRNDAAGLAQIMRTGWFKQVRIKSRDSYQVRSLLVAREMPVAHSGPDRERDPRSSAHLRSSLWQTCRGPCRAGRRDHRRRTRRVTGNARDRRDPDESESLDARSDQDPGSPSDGSRKGKSDSASVHDHARRRRHHRPVGRPSMMHHVSTGPRVPGPISV